MRILLFYSKHEHKPIARNAQNQLVPALSRHGPCETRRNISSRGALLRFQGAFALFRSPSFPLSTQYFTRPMRRLPSRFCSPRSAFVKARLHVGQMEQERVEGTAQGRDEGMLRTLDRESIPRNKRRRRRYDDEAAQDDRGPARRGISERIHLRGTIDGGDRWIVGSSSTTVKKTN
jgi:hypothetical protein